MKVLVVGSNGQLGADVVDVVKGHGDECVPATRKDVDVTDAASVEALIADPDLVALPEGTRPEAVDRFEELNADPETLADPARVFDDTVAKIEGNRISRRLDALEAEIRGSGTGEQHRLIRDKEKLMKEIQALPVDWRRSGKALSNLGRTRQGGRERQ